MKGRPEILSGEDSDTVLMGLSMLALMMYPVACFGITLIATWQHPKRMARMTLVFWFIAISFSTNGGRSATGLQSLL